MKIIKLGWVVGVCDNLHENDLKNFERLLKKCDTDPSYFDESETGGLLILSDGLSFFQILISIIRYSHGRRIKIHSLEMYNISIKILISEMFRFISYTRRDISLFSVLKNIFGLLVGIYKVALLEVLVRAGVGVIVANNVRRRFLEKFFQRKFSVFYNREICFPVDYPCGFDEQIKPAGFISVVGKLPCPDSFRILVDAAECWCCDIVVLGEQISGCYLVTSNVISISFMGDVPAARSKEILNNSIGTFVAYCKTSVNQRLAASSKVLEAIEMNKKVYACWNAGLVDAFREYHYFNYEWLDR